MEILYNKMTKICEGLSLIITTQSAKPGDWKKTAEIVCVHFIFKLNTLGHNNANVALYSDHKISKMAVLHTSYRSSKVQNIFSPIVFETSMWK